MRGPVYKLVERGARATRYALRSPRCKRARQGKGRERRGREDAKQGKGREAFRTEKRPQPESREKEKGKERGPRSQASPAAFAARELGAGELQDDTAR